MYVKKINNQLKNFNCNNVNVFVEYQYYFQYQFKLRALLRTRSFINNNLIIYIN